MSALTSEHQLSELRGSAYRDGKPNPSLLDALVREASHARLGDDGRLYRHTPEGIYTPDGCAESDRIVTGILGPDTTPRLLRDVRYLLMSGHPTLLIGEADDPDYLSVRNGLLRWSDLALPPHTPDLTYLSKIPVCWKPDAVCPLIDKFLSETFEGEPDVVAFLYEWIGYTLLPGNTYKSALMCVGSGGEGKSVILNVIRALLGPENVSAVPLHDLAGNRFAAAGLFGKKANIVGDLPASEVTASDVFKKITGGDSIWLERKGQDGFSYVVPGKLLFSANDLPRTADTSRAFFDRLHIVNFKHSVPDDRKDPDLLAKLTTPAELEGLLVKAVHAARRLRERGGFEVPASVRAAVAAYRADEDIVLSFLEERCEVGSGMGPTDRKALYSAFQGWAIGDAGRRVIRNRGFYNRLRDHVGPDRMSNGVRVFDGVRLLTAPSAPSASVVPDAAELLARARAAGAAL